MERNYERNFKEVKIEERRKEFMNKGRKKEREQRKGMEEKKEPNR